MAKKNKPMKLNNFLAIWLNVDDSFFESPIIRAGGEIRIRPMVSICNNRMIFPGG